MEFLSNINITQALVFLIIANLFFLALLFILQFFATTIKAILLIELPSSKRKDMYIKYLQQRIEDLQSSEKIKD